MIGERLMTNDKFTSIIKVIIINRLKKIMVNTTLYNALLPIQKEEMNKLLLIITETT
jgi:hypothetical protein